MRPILRVPPPPNAFSTSFAATENPLSESGAWRTAVQFYKQPQTTPGKCFSNGVTANFDDAVAQLLTLGSATNYRLGIHVFRAGGYNPGVSHEIGMYLRVQVDNSNPSNTLIRGYECLLPYDSTAFQIFRWEGVNHAFPDNFTQLSFTTLGSGLANVQNGDFLEAQIVGNVITCYQNGVAFATVTDSTWSNSGPGIGFFPQTGATPSNFCITDYTATRL